MYHKGEGYCEAMFSHFSETRTSKSGRFRVHWILAEGNVRRVYIPCGRGNRFAVITAMEEGIGAQLEVSFFLSNQFFLGYGDASISIVLNLEGVCADA